MSPEERIAKLNEQRAARKAGREQARIEQYSLDLEALNAAEEQHGDDKVRQLEVPYTPGLPTMAIVRCPDRTEIKVYRGKVSEKKPDHHKAAAWLGLSCLVYPSKEVFEAMVEQTPGLDSQAGLMAINLSVAKVSAEGEG